MNWPGLDLSATVLKLPHHGSRYSWSETFINQVNPRYGVVCAGWNNPFGHPNREVLERAQDKGIRVFRTDLDGAVTFLTRGEDIRIYTGP
jgi:competence protein ComEC